MADRQADRQLKTIFPSTVSITGKMAALSSQKSSHWLIVYFPEDEYQESKEKAYSRIEEFVQTKLPSGWSFGNANMEKCPKSNRYHYQGYLKTLYVRGTDVKKAIGDRAHIEKSNNRNAVVNYSNKDATRVDTVLAPAGVPAPWEYIDNLAKKWAPDEFTKFAEGYSRHDERMDEIALDYVDKLVSMDIENGANGVEFIAVNPMFRSAWKKFWRSIIKRNAAQSQSQPQVREPSEESDEEGS